MLSSKVKEMILQGKYDEKLSYLYVCDYKNILYYRERLINAVKNFEYLFGKYKDISIFSAPGRTEIGGNHTDHQHGRVLAASVNLDVIAVVATNNSNIIQIKSEDYPMDTVDTSELSVNEKEYNKSAALIRGTASKFTDLGYKIGGFDAYTTSNVLSGSGLSSSAAFEVLIGTIINHLFCSSKESALKIAQIGQYAENVYFGKPCGLMDQAASSVGGFISIDFKNTEKPKVKKIEYNFAESGYSLCIIDTKGNHADLTPDYAAIPAEMKSVAKFFGKNYLCEIDEESFFENIPDIRKKTGDRAVLRAIHYFEDNKRVLKEVSALEANDFEKFKNQIIESGYSSYMYLQNVFSPSHIDEQGVSLTLALCERYLRNKGAYRVHGGGFAGTVQSFVPLDYLNEFVQKIENIIGKDSCHVLSIRPVGGTKIL